MSVDEPVNQPRPKYSASKTAAAIAGLDEKTQLFLGAVPVDGKISVQQVADILDASRLRIYQLISAGELPSEVDAKGAHLFHICDVIAYRDR
jgi:hypothetical protein